MDSISRLCAWFERQCVGEWHEDHGIKIDTIDNPGWSMKADLAGRGFRRRSFRRSELNDRSMTGLLLAEMIKPLRHLAGQ
ncbi:UNVERIFIED_ORG: hypothetical protein GGI57_000601 [Rhizobium aethiopicum]